MQYVGRVSLMWRPQEIHLVKETKEPQSWYKKILGERKKLKIVHQNLVGAISIQIFIFKILKC